MYMHIFDSQQMKIDLYSITFSWFYFSQTFAASSFDLYTSHFLIAYLPICNTVCVVLIDFSKFYHF